MAFTYKLLADRPTELGGGKTEAVQRTASDGIISIVPFDPANTDYQEYLAWVAEGNTAEAAD